MKNDHVSFSLIWLHAAFSFVSCLVENAWVAFSYAVFWLTIYWIKAKEMELGKGFKTQDRIFKKGPVSHNKL